MLAYNREACAGVCMCVCAHTREFRKKLSQVGKDYPPYKNSFGTIRSKRIQEVAEVLMACYMQIIDNTNPAKLYI